MKTLCILLIEDDPEYAALVLAWLSAEARAPKFVLHWTDSLAAAAQRLEEGGVDLVLMDLGLPDSQGLETFSAVRAKAPDLPIVILSAGEDEGMALESIQQGAQDYLIKLSCSPDMLIRTLRHTMMRHKSTATKGTPAKKDKSSRAQIIGVLGASGGSGVTTIASVLASDLIFHTEQSALLIDLDLSPGLVAFTTGVDPQYSVQDALENADRLDASIWEGIITKRGGNLDILASTRGMSAGDFDVGRTRELLDFTTTMYQWVVLDLGRLNHYSKQVARWADEILLVTTPAIPALHLCKHAIEILEHGKVDRERIRLILNRKDSVHRLTSKEIQRLFGIEIDATLPPAHRDLYEACLQKRLPAVTSDFRGVLSRVARKLAGLPDIRPKPLLLRPLASLTDRLRQFSDSSAAEAVASSETR